MLSNDDGDIPSLNWWWWLGSVLVSWWGVVVSPQGVTRSPIFHLPRRPWTKTSTWRCWGGTSQPPIEYCCATQSNTFVLIELVQKNSPGLQESLSIYTERGAKSSVVLPSWGQWLVLCAHVSIMAFLRPDKRDLLLIPPPPPPLS